MAIHKIHVLLNSVDEEDDELEQMRRNDTEEKSQWKISIEKIKEDHDQLAFESKV